MENTPATPSPLTISLSELDMAPDWVSKLGDQPAGQVVWSQVAQRERGPQRGPQRDGRGERGGDRPREAGRREWGPPPGARETMSARADPAPPADPAGRDRIAARDATARHAATRAAGATVVSAMRDGATEAAIASGRSIPARPTLRRPPAGLASCFPNPPGWRTSRCRSSPPAAPIRCSISPASSSRTTNVCASGSSRAAPPRCLRSSSARSTARSG